MASPNTYLLAELENRIQFETLISEISASFLKLSSSEIDNEIACALKQIMNFFKVDRCGVLGVHEDKQFVSVTHICSAEGMKPVSKEINLEWFKLSCTALCYYQAAVQESYAIYFVRSGGGNK